MKKQFDRKFDIETDTSTKEMDRKAFKNRHGKVKNTDTQNN